MFIKKHIPAFTPTFFTPITRNYPLTPLLLPLNPLLLPLTLLLLL